MAESPLGLDPERVNKFLQDELNGSAPPEIVEFVNRQRKASPGLFPPPIFPETGVGRVNNTGKVLPAPPAAPLPAPPAPSMGLKDSLIAATPTMGDVKAGGRKLKAGFESAANALADPEALAATAAGMATASRSTPVGFLASGTAGKDIMLFMRGEHPTKAPLHRHFSLAVRGN